MRAAIVLWSGKIAEEFLSRRGFRRALISMVFCLAGCATPPTGVEAALASAAKANFAPKILPAGEFQLFALQRLDLDPGSVLTVYIEGDGRAWRRKRQPAPNPSPRQPVTLALALKDPGPAVLYLARPCQYQPPPLPAACDVNLWTTHRYSETVIAAINSAINQAAEGFERVALVGHSGGGTVATLVAARRRDVAWLITIAANLDHRAWTEMHRVSPLTGSLNAADYAHAVEKIPQLHLVGGRDEIVTAEVIRSFVDRIADQSQVHVQVETEFDHDCCWEKHWPELRCALTAVGC